MEFTKQEFQDVVSSTIGEFDPEMLPTSSGFSELAVLLASTLGCGANETLIAEIMEYDPEFVSLVGARLRSAKIWSGDEVDQRAIDRWQGDDGSVALSCDANVANGHLIIQRYENGEPLYQMSEEGRKHVQSMLKR